jgi:hypothetical protein
LRHRLYLVHYMYPRFRRLGSRIRVSLVASVRRGDRVQQEYLWSLGTLSLEPTLAERHKFWTRVAEVLAPYAPAQRAPVVAALAARVEPPTPEQMQAEIATAQARNAAEQARIMGEIARWDERAREHRERAAGVRAFIANLQTEVLPGHERAAAEAMREAQAARVQLARLKADNE